MSVTVNLPDVTTCANQLYLIQIDTGFVADLTPAIGDTVNGSSSVLVVNGLKVILLYSDGVGNWSVLGT